MPPPRKAERKTRTKKRKARTEVSSSSGSDSSLSSSSSDSEVETQPTQKTTFTKSTNLTNAQITALSPSPSLSSNSDPELTDALPPAETNVSQQWFLQQATKEFGKDLLALRASKDFVPGVSEGLIVRALEGMGRG